MRLLHLHPAPSRAAPLPLLERGNCFGYSLDAPFIQPRMTIYIASSPADYNICPETLSTVQQYQQKFTDRRSIFLPEYSKLEADTSSSKHSSTGAKFSFTEGSEEKLTQGCPKIPARFVTSCCKRKLS